MQGHLAQLREQGTSFIVTRYYYDAPDGRKVHTLDEMLKLLEADGMAKLLDPKRFDDEIEEWLGRFTLEVSVADDNHIADRLSVASILAAWYYAKCKEIEAKYTAGSLTTRSFQSALSRAKARVISRF